MHERIPTEALGQARELRRLLGDTEKQTVAQIHDLIKPLHRRALRSATPDRADLVRVARAWPLLAPYGRLALDVRQQRTNLTVTETRVGACRLQGAHWDEPEPGIAINRVSLSVKRCEMLMDTPLVAAIGLHAIARRLSRGWHNDIDTILDEFRQMASHADSLMMDHHFTMYVADGRWVGELIDVDGYAAMRFQTFLV